jgi:hypothetical protein
MLSDTSHTEQHSAGVGPVALRRLRQGQGDGPDTGAPVLEQHTPEVRQGPTRLQANGLPTEVGDGGQ